jgi:hypothetical protein
LLDISERSASFGSTGFDNARTKASLAASSNTNSARERSRASAAVSRVREGIGQAIMGIVVLDYDRIVNLTFPARPDKSSSRIAWLLARLAMTLDVTKIFQKIF